MLEDYLQTNIASNKELQIHTGYNQKKIARLLNKLKERVIKIYFGKTPRYALTTSSFNAGDKIHIWKVDNFGKHSTIATLRPLATGGFFVEQQVGMPKVFLGESTSGLYDDLPYFLVDMSPKGFLGKKIAETLALLDSSFPSTLADWNNEHIGRYLLSNTETSIGDLKFGNNVNLNIRHSVVKHSRSDYLKIADNIIDNDEVLSSAGGEQQKFTTFCSDINAHVIVKFSPKGSNENARRWKDILITEHYANMVINTTGMVIAAETKIFEFGDRIFLESVRFDRDGEKGRRSMLSLTMIDAEFVGNGSTWLNSAIGLYKQKLINKQDLANVEWLSAFAKLINNTDTHLGNISFAAHNEGFSLLPIYDMCSMGFAPKSNGEVTPLKFVKPVIAKLNYCSLKELEEIAALFWKTLIKDRYISAEFVDFIEKKLL